MKSVFVTGAHGFIGGALCRALQRDGCTVSILARRELVGHWHRTHFGDITQPIDPQFLKGVDTIFHLAGKAHALSEVRQDDADYFRINTLGTRNVLEAARQARVPRFVLFSSVKAMSRDLPEPFVVPERPWTETDIIQPDTSYGRSKLEAESVILAPGAIPEPVVLRLTAVYGPGAKGNLKRMLVAIDRGRFPPLPPTGNRRSMVHVEDAVAAAIRAATHPLAPGERFIVADSAAPTVRELYEEISAALGRTVPRWSVPGWALRGIARMGDLIGAASGRRFAFDSDMLRKLTEPAWFSAAKLESTLGFHGKWNFRRALPELVAQLRSEQLPKAD